MRVLLILFVACLAASANGRHFNGIEQEWENFKLSFKKQYTEAEDAFRMKVFAEKMIEIAEHNQLYLEGKKSFTMKMNQFGDMLHSEFVSTMNGYRGHNVQRNNAATFIKPNSDVVLPDTVDWRQKGAVTPVKDQLQCGSCWAFSTTGSLEGQHFLKDGELVSLSEQNLVACSTENDGCSGGLMDWAFEYIKTNGGIDTEDSYPYIAVDDIPCFFNKSAIGATDVGFVDIKSGDVEALKAAVATIGPVSIAIDASQPSFHLYSGGVYSDPDCSPTQLDHGVLAVGYGTMNGTAYWLVKNSWGTTWGDKGYMYMARNDGNMCGVATMASYPLV